MEDVGLALSFRLPLSSLLFISAVFPLQKAFTRGIYVGRAIQKGESYRMGGQVDGRTGWFVRMPPWEGMNLSDGMGWDGMGC